MSDVNSPGEVPAPVEAPGAVAPTGNSVSEVVAESAEAPAAVAEVPVTVPPVSVKPPPPSVPERARKSLVAPALISLDRVDDDGQFRFRDPGDVTALATDIARLGQLFPIEVRLRAPDRFQVVSGFRRVKALRFLQREKVLARLHTDLPDDDATLIALAEAIHCVPMTRDQLAAVQVRLEDEGRLTPPVRDMLAKSLSDGDGLEPEQVGGDEDDEGTEEVDADELAADATLRQAELNQDLKLLADAMDDLDPMRRRELLEQLRYARTLLEWLEGKA